MKLKTLIKKVKEFAKGYKITTAEETLSVLYMALDTLGVIYRISKKHEVIVNVSGHPKVIAKIAYFDNDICHPYLKEFIKFM